MYHTKLLRTTFSVHSLNHLFSNVYEEIDPLNDNTEDYGHSTNGFLYVQTTHLL